MATDAKSNKIAAIPASLDQLEFKGATVTTIMPTPIVIHVPHAATAVPPDIRPDLLLTEDELTAEQLRMTDWFTDELFHLDESEATTVRFPVSRLVVDPERFLDDADEPMAARGMGVIYTLTSQGKPLREPVSAQHRQHLIDRLYHPHHARLTEVTRQALAQHGWALIFDAHSFASTPLPHETDQSPDRPDVCIGTDKCHTPAWLADAAVEAYRAQGFSVEVNRPFAGSLVPMAYYGKDARVMSVMVELNRRLYMNESTGMRSAAFESSRSRNRTALHQVVGTTNAVSTATVRRRSNYE